MHQVRGGAADEYLIEFLQTTRRTYLKQQQALSSEQLRNLAQRPYIDHVGKETPMTMQLDLEQLKR
jgi:hypothetical protein